MLGSQAACLHEQNMHSARQAVRGNQPLLTLRLYQDEVDFTDSRIVHATRPNDILACRAFV
jgi:hypothetical protein